MFIIAMQWGRSVSLSASEARSEELDKRRKFSQVFGKFVIDELLAGKYSKKFLNINSV